MADSQPTPIAFIDRGIASLRACLGVDGEALLKKVENRRGELASFEFPLPEDFLGVSRTLHIGFCAGFPSRSLRLRIDPSPWLLWPHAMKDGVCLFGSGQRPTSGTPEEVVENTIRRIGLLMQLVIPQSDPTLRKKEFDSEITTYWHQQLGCSVQQLILLNRPSKAQMLYALTDMRLKPSVEVESVWLADDAQRLARHWERITGQRQKVKSPAAAAFYVPLTITPTVEVPSESKLIDWLETHMKQEHFHDLKHWYADSAALPVRWIILELPNSEPSSLFALVLRGSGLRRDGQQPYGRRAGRRFNHAPVDSTPKSLEWCLIHLLDRATIHSRDASTSNGTLEGAHVVVIGAGTLGSTVASILARTGVGKLSLIDPDLLMDANLGRHVLGADDLGRLKTTALRERLRRDVPTAEIASIPDYVQFIKDDTIKSFFSADLVIVTSADWPSEMFLWKLKARGAKWALLQAWSEPYGEVGHALYAPSGSHDASDFFDSTGRFHHRFTHWPENGVIVLPACGASYIPAGPATLATIAAMIARAAIDGLMNVDQEPTWYSSVGNIKAISNAGGTYSGPDVPNGMLNVVFSRQWPTSME